MNDDLSFFTVLVMDIDLPVMTGQAIVFTPCELTDPPDVMRTMTVGTYGCCR